MYLLKKDELKELINKNQEHCISIYLPTDNTSKESRQNPIRLKNLIKKAETQLKAKGCTEEQIQEIVAPAYDLAMTDSASNIGDEGLAIFMTKGYFKKLSLPQKFDEFFAVNDRFHLKPILPFFTNDKRFFVLAISENKLSLLNCTKYYFEQVEILGMPKNRSDALDYILKDKRERDLPYKGNGNDKGNTNTLSGGSGGGEELENERVLQYFRDINKHISKYLKEYSVPLILASTEENFAIYKKANTYKKLQSTYIKGNPDRTSFKQLHEKGLKLAQEVFSKSIDKTLDKYIKLYGTDNTVHNINDALIAAYEGRIESLIIAEDKVKWGHFNTNTTFVEEHPKQKPGDHDLLDLAAIYTLQNHGKVLVLKSEDIPRKMEVAGILRF